MLIPYQRGTYTKATKAQRAKRLAEPLSVNKVIDHGTITVDEYVKLGIFPEWMANKLHYGDQETLDKYLALRNSLAHVTPPQTADFTTYDLAGSFVDVGRFMSGEPECMVDFVTRDAQKFVDVNITYSRPNHTIEPVFMRYFGLIVDAIDRFESAGYRCRVYVRRLQVHLKKREINKLSILFKDYQDKLNLGVMAALIMNNDINTFFISRYYQYFGDAVGVDMYPDYELIQTETQITLPSIRYNQNATLRRRTQDWDGLNVDWLLGQAKLAHFVTAALY